MVHENLTIEHQPQPLQELFIEREAIKAKLGQAALMVTMANETYHAAIVEMLHMNERIREEEMHQ